MKRWTPDEEALMLQYYRELGPKKTAALLGRTVHATDNKAGSMGIRKPQQHKYEPKPKQGRKMPPAVREMFCSWDCAKELEEGRRA